MKKEKAIPGSQVCLHWLTCAVRQRLFHLGCTGGKGQFWTEGGGLLATCWGPASESAPRLAYFIGVPSSTCLGSRGLGMVF